jgi:hypothetical protein
MKTIVKLCSVVSMGCLIPVGAQTAGSGTGSGTSDRYGSGAAGAAGAGTSESGRMGTGTSGQGTSRDVTGQASGTQTSSTTFTADARTKALKYFETHKGSQHGLPANVAAKIKTKEMPQQWKSSRIDPGTMFQEKERTYLVEAPADLVEQLPSAPSGVRYYIAGSNVVAVDQNFRVVDSIQIPTIQFNEERSSSSSSSSDR